MFNPPMPLEVEYGGLAEGRCVHIAGMDKKFISKCLGLLHNHAIGRHDRRYRSVDDHPVSGLGTATTQVEF